MAKPKYHYGICFKCRLKNKLPFFKYDFLPQRLKEKCVKCLHRIRNSRKLLNILKWTDPENLTLEQKQAIERLLEAPCEIPRHTTSSRSANSLKKYKITPEHFAALYEFQDGKCAICKKPELRLNVDHNHSNGKVRALLCRGCNTGLGCFGDNVQVLKAAAAYIEHHAPDLGLKYISKPQVVVHNIKQEPKESAPVLRNLDNSKHLKALIAEQFKDDRLSNLKFRR